MEVYGILIRAWEGIFFLPLLRYMFSWGTYTFLGDLHVYIFGTWAFEHC